MSREEALAEVKALQESIEQWEELADRYAEWGNMVGQARCMAKIGKRWAKIERIVREVEENERLDRDGDGGRVGGGVPGL